MNLTQIDVAKSNECNPRHTQWTFFKYWWLNEEQKYFTCQVLGLSGAAQATRNIMQAIYVTSNSLGATLKKGKENWNGFGHLLYLT